MNDPVVVAVVASAARSSVVLEEGLPDFQFRAQILNFNASQRMKTRSMVRELLISVTHNNFGSDIHRHRYP
jgi:hypothetical protein